MQTTEEAMKNPYNNAALNIMYTAGWLQSNISQVLKPLGISEPQFNVLRILFSQKGEPISLFEIQEKMIQKMSNVSRLVDKLLERNLVVRKECKDNRRKVDILLTEQGIELLEVATPMVHKIVKTMLQDVPIEKLEGISVLLSELRGVTTEVTDGNAS